MNIKTNDIKIKNIVTKDITTDKIINLEEQIFNSFYPKGRYIFIDPKIGTSSLPVYKYYDNQGNYKTKDYNELWKQIEGGYIYLANGSGDGGYDQTSNTQYVHSHYHEIPYKQFGYDTGTITIYDLPHKTLDYKKTETYPENSIHYDIYIRK